MQSVRSGLKSGRALIGTMLTLPTPEVAEIMASLDFDWLFVDCEHGSFTAPDVRSILQTTEGRTPCLVRVPEVSRSSIQSTLDLGASGIIVPQVNTAEEAERVVDFARYVPLGSRGVGLARAHGYGPRFNDYLASANDEVAVVVQAEHRLAVENLDAIVQVPGVDAVLIGPYDLSASYHKAGQLDDPEIVEAIAHIETTCQAAQMPVGIFGVSVSAVQPYIKRGFNFVCAGVDTLMLGKEASAMLEALSTDN